MPPVIRKATRKEIRLRMMLTGPTKSGKTYTALRMLMEIAPLGKRGYIDSEHGRAELYVSRPNPDRQPTPEQIAAGHTYVPDESNTFQFDTYELDGNYSPEAYIAAIRAFEAAGYTAVVIDSLSHEWTAKGGILDMVDKEKKFGGNKNQLSPWAKATPKHQELIEAILGSKVHIIATARSKMEYAIEKNAETGKNDVKRIGLKAVQRDDLEYEFDVLLDMDMDHVGRVAGTRFDEIDAITVLKPGAKLARTLMHLITEGAVPISEQDRQAAAERAALAQRAAQEMLAKQAEERAVQERAERDAKMSDADKVTERNHLNGAIVTLCAKIAKWKSDGPAWRRKFVEEYLPKIQADLTQLRATHKQLQLKQAEHDKTLPSSTTNSEKQSVETAAAAALAGIEVDPAGQQVGQPQDDQQLQEETR